MNLILVISMIMIFYLGFIFIDKICVLFDPIDFPVNEDNTVSNSNKSMQCLIFGNNNISLDIAKFLDKLSFNYSSIKNIHELKNLDSYNYIFAVDKLDLENLIICSLSKKNNSTKFIAICNCSYNRKIFEDNNIPYLFGENIQASQIVKTLLSTSQGSGGNFNVHI